MVKRAMVFLCGALSCASIGSAPLVSAPFELPALLPDTEYRHLLPARYAALVYQAAEKYNVPVFFIVRLIHQETKGTWDRKIVSRKNKDGTRDKGLAQANSKYLSYYADRYGLTDPTNAEQSIMFCAAYSADLYKATGSWLYVACAYKMGLNGFKKSRSGVPVRVYTDASWIVFGG